MSREETGWKVARRGGSDHRIEKKDGTKETRLPPLQKRKWSRQRRQNSKPPSNAPQWIRLTRVNWRSASFVHRRGKGSFMWPQGERGEHKGDERCAVSNGKHEGWVNFMCSCHKQKFIWLSNRCSSWMCNRVSCAELLNEIWKTAFVCEKLHGLMAFGEFCSSRPNRETSACLDLKVTH